MFSEEQIPQSVQAADGDQIIAWAVTDYGLDFYWRCSSGQDPDRWPVRGRLGEPWHEYEITATQLLEGLISGSIEHPNFDPLEEHHFISIDDFEV